MALCVPQMETLLKTLLESAEVGTETRRLLETREGLSCAQDLLQNLGSVALETVSTPAEANEESLLDQIATLGSRAAQNQREVTTALSSSWEGVIRGFSQLQEAETQLAQLETDLEKLSTLPITTTTSSPVNPLEMPSLISELDPLIALTSLSALNERLLAMNKYASCIESSSLSTRLAIRYPQSALVDQTRAAVAFGMRDMTIRLARLLSTNVKQAHIVKIVALLKRTSGTNVVSLYYKSRHEFILSEMGSLQPLLEAGMVSRFWTRMVEVVREHCLQSVMVGQSLFGACVPLEQAFVKSVVCELIKSLEPVQDVDRAGIIQLGYCAKSVARVGGEFTELLPEKWRQAAEST